MKKRYTPRDTGVEKILLRTMGNSRVILWIQALVNAKITENHVINTQSYSDVVPKIKYVAHHQITYSL